MKRTFPVAMAFGLLLAMPVGAAGMAVIVHPSTATETMSREQVSHVFLGRVKTLPSGETATVIDTLPQREAFYRGLVGKGLAEINAYWARLRFSGRTQPPLQMNDARAVIDRVASVPGSIAYVDAALVDRRVKTVFRLD